MKRIGFLLLTGVLILLISGCSENGMLTPDDPANQTEATFKGAKKPLPKLIGNHMCHFDPGHPMLFSCSVDFGDYGKYEITFIPHGPPRDFSQASIFEEDFIIHYEGTDWTQAENVVMIGFLRGTHTLANRPPDPTRFITNGDIFEAYGPLEMFEGRKVHQDGIFHWTAEGGPDWIESTFRIN